MKEPKGKSKGILTFTHKERWVFDGSTHVLDALIDRAHERYFFLMHWGHYAKNEMSDARIDMHLASPGTVSFASDHPVRQLPLSSRNFLPSIFSPTDYDPFIDILTIGRPSPIKGLDEFLVTAKHVLDVRPETTILMLVPNNQRWTWRTLKSDYHRILEPHHQRQVHLVSPELVGNLFPLPPRAVAMFYHASRMFALFSHQEGQSKVVHEALLCGLPILARRNVRGGARDLLDETNSRLFSSPEEAAARAIEILDSANFELPTPELENELREENSIPRLMRELENLYRDHGMPLDGEIDTDNLDKKLPGHALLLPAEYRLSVTDDLASRRAAAKFLGRLIGDPPSTWQMLDCGFRDLRNTFRRRAYGLKNRIWSILKS